jgi:hypothetical protein
MSFDLPGQVKRMRCINESEDKGKERSACRLGDLAPWITHHDQRHTTLNQTMRIVVAVDGYGMLSLCPRNLDWCPEDHGLPASLSNAFEPAYTLLVPQILKWVWATIAQLPHLVSRFTSRLISCLEAHSIPNPH